MKNNHKGAQINGVSAYAHSFSLIFFFFSSFLWPFYLHFYILFFHKSVAKTRYNTRVSKKFSYVCHRFSALSLIDCLANLETSNAKTHNTKIIGIIFLFLLDIYCLFWI
jgi:hypothetical protein